jgi:hypothetical protein
MRTIISIIIISLILSCSQKRANFDYYVFSKQDSINSIWRYDLNNNQYYPPPPPPPPPPELAWYSNVVIIFDTLNRIYLYQTECIQGKVSNNINDPYIIPEKCPNFINLIPNHIITLHLNYFLDFISDNDEFFRLDTNYREFHRIIYLVSDFDTITNQGYYNLIKHIKTDKNKRARIYYILRRTTEEEKNVLYCKRIKKYYNPQDFNWSTNFFDGKTRPFTNRYDSLENISGFLIKSGETFKPEMTRLRPIE